MANTTRQFGQTIQIKTGKPEKKITKTGFYIWITALWKDDIAPSPSPEYLYLVMEYWYPTEWNALLHFYIIRHVLVI